MSDGTEDYGIDKIQKLEGIEHVRTRPAMYIGDTAEMGLHHLIYEVVDNSIDEAVAGFGKKITVTIQKGDTICVEDFGRGIPTAIHPDTGMTGVEMVMTELFAGGKFDNDAYKTSGGLHGVGVSCVNALSEWCVVEVKREGKIHHQRYEKGEAKGPLKVIGEADHTGTTTTFKPDTTIFEVLVFQFEIVQSRLRELAYLNKGVSIVLVDERDDREEVFHYEGGIAAYVEYLNEGLDAAHQRVIHLEAESDGVWVELALQYNTGFGERIYSFANNINTREGGTHLSGFKSSLSRNLLNYAKQSKKLKDRDPKPEGADWREGLTAILSVRIPEPKFEGQTKQKLGNKEVEGQVQQALNQALATVFEEDPETAQAIVLKGLDAARARAAAKKARDLARKSATSGGGLPGKLADCARKGREGTEVFLVEGDSAGGSAKTCREKEFQAILPLRGKILNVEKAHPEKMLGHNEINVIIQALGTSIGSEFDIEKLRYDKIILMCDADVDGSHIRTLLLTFFFRHLRPLVEAGHVYVAQPPLYKVSSKGKGKKLERFVTSDDEMNSELTDRGASCVTLRRGEDPVDTALFEALLTQLQSVEQHAVSLRSRGVTLNEYIRHWDAESKTLPRIQVRQNGDRRYFSDRAKSEQYFDELRAEASEEEPLVIFEGDDVFASRPAEAIERVPLPDAVPLASALAELESLGFPPEQLSRSDQSLNYIVEDDPTVHPLKGLLTLLPAVRQFGLKGLDRQRFKGLGEMNPDQLWETTMDPGQRTLKRVEIVDEIRSDRMFKMLMGTEVTKRKEFILDHALSVTDVDV